jgi:hypothetical protein
MNFNFSAIAKTVPAICILCGFVAVFILKEAAGWIFVILGVGLQVAYLARRDRW